MRPPAALKAFARDCSRLRSAGNCIALPDDSGARRDLQHDVHNAFLRARARRITARRYRESCIPESLTRDDRLFFPLFLSQVLILLNTPEGDAISVRHIRAGRKGNSLERNELGLGFGSLFFFFFLSFLILKQYAAAFFCA